MTDIVFDWNGNVMDRVIVHLERMKKIVLILAAKLISGSVRNMNGIQSLVLPNINAAIILLTVPIVLMKKTVQLKQFLVMLQMVQFSNVLMVDNVLKLRENAMDYTIVAIYQTRKIIVPQIILLVSNISSVVPINHSVFKRAGSATVASTVRISLMNLQHANSKLVLLEISNAKISAVFRESSSAITTMTAGTTAMSLNVVSTNVHRICGHVLIRDTASLSKNFAMEKAIVWTEPMKRTALTICVQVLAVKQDVDHLQAVESVLVLRVINSMRHLRELALILMSAPSSAIAIKIVKIIVPDLYVHVWDLVTLWKCNTVLELTI
jgi:hypothetical protein